MKNLFWPQNFFIESNSVSILINPDKKQASETNLQL